MRTSPLRKLTDADLDVLVERIGRGESQRAVAAELEVAQSSVSRLLRRLDVAARVRVVRDREAARKRQAAKRRRDREMRMPEMPQSEMDAITAANAPKDDPNNPARGPRRGTEFPKIDRDGYYWPHCLTLYVGKRLATRRDYTDNGWTVPPDLEDADPMLAFGPPDAPPRYPIGYVPPEDRPTIRVVRVEQHPTYGPLEVRKSVSPSELDEATAEGWQLAS